MTDLSNPKEIGKPFAEAFLAVEGLPDVEYGHDGVMALAHAYLDLVAERDALREALRKIAFEAGTRHQVREIAQAAYEAYPE